MSFQIIFKMFAILCILFMLPLSVYSMNQELKANKKQRTQSNQGVKPNKELSLKMTNYDKEYFKKLEEKQLNKINKTNKNNVSIKTKPQTKLLVKGINIATNLTENNANTESSGEHKKNFNYLAGLINETDNKSQNDLHEDLSNCDY